MTQERTVDDVDWQPDLLGAGYRQHVLDLGPDPDGEAPVQAVLVRRDPDAGPPPRGVVLYTHGYTDYFFQAELADFAAARGLAFYALDLRKCGRATRPGQTPHYVSRLALYDAELDRALAIVTAAHPGLPVVLVAHSTGGLIMALWQHRRRAEGGNPAVAAMVLNSPWLDLQGSALLRGPVTQAMRVLAKVAPMRAVKMRPGAYGSTLHVSGTGEWDFSTDLKPLSGYPARFGWLNAIRRGQARLHRGLDVGVPVLVLRSARSHFAAEYSEVSDHADLVLDTLQIGQWAASLGTEVTDIPVEDARHDVLLSIPQSRARAYQALDGWLGSVAALRSA
ncbi:MAG TPA: alpha/beta hydrolase [Trebonia sp.]|nr:alpha/beta hydrolase [Trebonia sp.]